MSDHSQRIQQRRHGRAVVMRERGFSLIELMVASTIGLIIMFAILTLYLNVTRTNDEMSKTNGLIENGRYALDIIQYDLMHAGYWDGYVPQFDDLTAVGIPSDVPEQDEPLIDPCIAFADWGANPDYEKHLLGTPVQVYGYSAPSTVCDAIAVDRQPNTDMLVVRHADNCEAGAAGCTVPVGELRFQASKCQGDADRYKFGTTSAALNLHAYTSSVAPEPCDDPGNTFKAETRQFISNIYYVRSWAVTAGDNIPTLMRSTFGLVGGQLKHMAAEPIVEGIEAFHIELGIDNKSKTNADVDYSAAVNWADETNKSDPTNRGDGVPDVYRVCPAAPAVGNPADADKHCNAADLRDAVVAKLYVLARTLEESKRVAELPSKFKLGNAPEIELAADSYKRHMFSTTVRLVNISTRRETP